MNSFTTTIQVSQSPEQVFHAITNVAAWWGGGEVSGRTDVLDAEFTYRYADVFRIDHKITEWVPNQKIVWHVTDSAINFPNPSEWTGTDIVFEIVGTREGTEVRFTHEGLVPACSCFEACRDGWTYHLDGLRRLIANDYTKTFLVDQTPEQVFAAINDVRGWWSEDIEGDTDRLGAAFTFRYQNMHRSVHKIRELVPGEKVVWHIPEADIHFVKDASEWNGTDVEFLIRKRADKTEVRFTHVGLVPKIECYGDCSGAWSFHLDSLKKLIETGTGEPNHKERG
jgi:uncharacterized protein YndB with AHSA1/START domain